MDDLISRQEAIYLLEHEIELSNRALDFAELVGTEREKFSWGLGLLESIAEDIKQLPSAEPKWIPVTEQTLPKHNSVVVVCGNKGTWDYGTYRGHTPSNINLWNWKKNTLREVHWWMYKEDALPKPWKGEEE